MKIGDKVWIWKTGEDGVICAIYEQLGGYVYYIKKNDGQIKAYYPNEFVVDEGLKKEKEKDNVNHPKHYTSHPSGVECIDITRHMSFNLGNAIKYIWRADLKGGTEDMEKAIWYLQDEINKRKKREKEFFPEKELCENLANQHFPESRNFDLTKIGKTEANPVGTSCQSNPQPARAYNPRITYPPETLVARSILGPDDDIGNPAIGA